MRIRIFLLGLTLVALAARPAAAGPAITVMDGGPSLAARTFLLNEAGQAVSELAFILHGAGRTISPAGPFEGAWFEAVLGGTGAWPPPTFRGPLDPSDISLDPGVGGTVRLPLGSYGEASLQITALGPALLPAGCRGASWDEMYWSDDGRQTWSWTATTYGVAPYVADVAGTAAGHPVTARPPESPDLGPLATLSENAVAYMYESPTLRATPVIGIAPFDPACDPPLI